MCVFRGVKYHGSGLEKNGRCWSFDEACKERDAGCSECGWRGGDTEQIWEPLANMRLMRLWGPQVCWAAREALSDLLIQPLLPLMENIPWAKHPYFIPMDIMYILLTECREILSLSISSCTCSNQIFQNSKNYFHCTLSAWHLSHLHIPPRVVLFVDLLLQGARYRSRQQSPCHQAGHILAGKTTSHHLVVQIEFRNLYTLQMSFTNTEFIFKNWERTTFLPPQHFSRLF